MSVSNVPTSAAVIAPGASSVSSGATKSSLPDQGANPRLGIIFLGPSFAGKSTMMYLYTRVPTEEQKVGATVISDQKTLRNVVVDGVKHDVVFRDIPGQDSCADNLGPSNLRFIQVAIVVADVSIAFDAQHDKIQRLGIANWVAAARRVNPSVEIVVALNKVDAIAGVRSVGKDADRRIVAFDDVTSDAAGIMPVKPADVDHYLSCQGVPALTTGDRRVFYTSALTGDGAQALLETALRVAYTNASRSTSAAGSGPAPRPVIVSGDFGKRSTKDPQKSATKDCAC